MAQITNIPDAIADIVSKMQPWIAYTSSGSSVNSFSCSGYDTQHFHYASISNLFIEFQDSNLFGKRYKINSITENRVNGTLSITIDSYVTLNRSGNCRLFLNYMFGHKDEIEARLIEMSGTPEYRAHKYPLLILFDPIREKRDPKRIFIETDINLVLVNSTNVKWKASDRLTNNFKAILHPYYELFINFLNTSSICQSSLIHDKIDRYFYSESEAKKQNVFAAELDAVEILNLDFKLLKFQK